MKYHRYSSVYPVNRTFDEACVTLRLCLLGQHGWHGAAATEIPFDCFKRLNFRNIPIPYPDVLLGVVLVWWFQPVFFQGVCCSEWLEHDLNWFSSGNWQLVEPIAMILTEDKKLKARNHEKHWATSAPNRSIETHQNSHSWTLHVVMFSSQKPSISYSCWRLLMCVLPASDDPYV